MAIVTMQLDETGDIIDVDLGNTRWIARKIIQDHEIIGFNVIDMDWQELHDLIETLGYDDRPEVQKYYGKK